MIIEPTLLVLQAPLSPPGIRQDLVMEIGVGQVSPLSSIHTVLRRMVNAGELEKTRRGNFGYTVDQTGLRSLEEVASNLRSRL